MMDKQTPLPPSPLPIPLYFEDESSFVESLTVVVAVYNLTLSMRYRLSKG